MEEQMISEHLEKSLELKRERVSRLRSMSYETYWMMMARLADAVAEQVTRLVRADCAYWSPETERSRDRMRKEYVFSHNTPHHLGPGTVTDYRTEPTEEQFWVNSLSCAEGYQRAYSVEIRCRPEEECGIGGSDRAFALPVDIWNAAFRGLTEDEQYLVALADTRKDMRVLWSDLHRSASLLEILALPVPQLYQLGFLDRPF